MRKSIDRLVVGAAVVLAILAHGCASSGGGSAASQAAREMKHGVKAAKRGYWQEALFRFERANAIVPQQPHTLSNLAVALEAVGRFEEAEAAYQAALAAAPGDRNLRRNYTQFKEFYASYVDIAESETDASGAEGEGDDAHAQDS